MGAILKSRMVPSTRLFHRVKVIIETVAYKKILTDGTRTMELYFQKGYSGVGEVFPRHLSPIRLQQRVSQNEGD